MPDLLLEVGLEEVPARMIDNAASELLGAVEGILKRNGLYEVNNEARRYSTPRRLSLHLSDVLYTQADTEEQLTGPAWNIAFKNDEPGPAALAFAKKAGVDLPALTKTTTSKGEYVSAVVHRPGRRAMEILAEELPKVLGSLSWPKSMYWRPGKPERFVRPLRWLLALLDEQIVPVEFAGITASNVTYGHRILHGEAPIVIGHPAEYLSKLQSAYVLADVDARRHKIRKALDSVARKVPDARWREDHELVETVTHLTEWPGVVLGSFEDEYLTLPEEVLVTVMRDHQKYFAVEQTSSHNGHSEAKLAPHFLAVLNTEADEAGLAIIRHGNERVLRARFNDARFFWNTDQKIPLAERVEMLKSVTFQKDLGSYYAKTRANLAITVELANALLAIGIKLDNRAVGKAVLLAKADLTTELVKEFTELQGVIGGLYARAQGLGETVAQAIYSQYMPASMEDAIPPTVEGQVLGLADRIHTIVEMFSIGFEPTGSKDPFALRRAANGIIKILGESALPVTLTQLIDLAVNLSERKDARALAARVFTFLEERLAFYLREVRGFAYAIVTAELSARAEDNSKAIKNSVSGAIGFAEDLTAMRGSEDFLAICAAFKRMKNILKQARDKGAFYGDKVDAALLHEPAEVALSGRYDELQRDFSDLVEQRRYRQALELIASLRPQVDAFFDAVMVMAPEPELRNNRLTLLNGILKYFSRIADFGELAAG